MAIRQIRLVSISLAAAVTGAASAQSIVNYGVHGSTYAQNFNGLAQSGNNAWSNSPAFPTVLGWSVWRAGTAGVSGTRENTFLGASNYLGDAGATGTGGVYSHGSFFSSDRALGTVASGTSGDQLILLAITNTTNFVMTRFTIGWRLEQWRQGGQTSSSPPLGTQHSLIFDYRVSTAAGVASNDPFANITAGFSAPGGNFDGTGPVGTAASSALIDGNAAGLQAGRGGTVTGITWNPGTTLILRWWDDNNTGNDHGLAIDDFEFQAVPEPGTIAALGIGAAALLRRRRNK